MRIASLRIENYKGLSLVELCGTADVPAVIITGKNGTGKSLILEAIAFAWSTRFGHHGRVGPWSEDLLIDLEVILTEGETSAVAAWHEKAGWGPPEEESYTLKRVIHSVRGDSTVNESRVVSTLRNAQFQRDHPFAAINFLPAVRQVPLSGNATVDLSLVNPELQDENRQIFLDEFMANRSPVTLRNVPSYLLTLDYQKLISDRQGLDVQDAYERVTEPFRLATSKTIRRPEYSPQQATTHIAVELPAGHKHDLDMLSSGEQELLALQFFIQRLAATGGVLLLDEPEQHLHPSLQATLLGSVQELSDSSQVFVVSHSAPLIAAADVTSLVKVDAPQDCGINQVLRLEEHQELVDLLGELGLRRSALVQADYFLIVEGKSDERWLRSMFPAELAHAQVVVAGGGNEVVAMCRTFRETGPALGMPWIAIRDRDFMSNEEVTGLTDKFPELLVHEGREIESIFLSANLIATVLSGIGEPVKVSEVTAALDRAADPLSSDVIYELSRALVGRRFPWPEVTDTDRWSRWKSELLAYAEINKERAASIDAVQAEVTQQVNDRWAAEKLELADPKIVLKRLHREFPRFRNPDAFSEALAAKIRESGDDVEGPARALRSHLHRAQGLEARGSNDVEPHASDDTAR